MFQPGLDAVAECVMFQPGLGAVAGVCHDSALTGCSS